MGKNKSVVKKAWYKRWWAITLFVIVGLIIVASFIGDDSGSSQGNLPADVESGNSQEVVSDYGLNQRFEHGNFAYTFNDVGTSDYIGNSYSGKEASGIFLIVDVTIENIGKETRTFFDNGIIFVDDQGRTFDTDDEAWVYTGEDNNFIVEQMQPGLPKRGKIIFDVPKNIDGKLRVSKGLFSSDYVYVSW